MIRWLHISDLHLGDNDMSSSQMRKKLISFIREAGQPIDYIFLTGDIKTAGPNFTGFTDAMATYLKGLCVSCGIGTDRLFIVPGNHDVNRDLPERDDAIKRVRFGWNGYYVPERGEIAQKDLTAIWEGQQEFRAFLAQMYSADRLKYYFDPAVPHFNIETEDFNLLHLDTTLTYTKGQEASNFIVGTKCLENVLETLNPQKPTILLTHFQYTALLQDEKKAVSTLLHDYGVRVWLAGHEHDHDLQPIKYLHHLQAGELRYEEKATSSFLIGEYDPDSFRCRVRAYKWFKEGWAKYPFVDLDAEKKDVYEFELKPKDSSVLPALTRKARKSNDAYKYRLPENLNRILFPAIEFSGSITTLNEILSSSWNNCDKGVILIGEGGMGKSTILLDFCMSSIIPALYISTEQLATMHLGIEEYCSISLFDGRKKTFEDSLRCRDRNPGLIIIVDGLNEVDAANERTYIQELQKIALFNGIQILIASRVDFTTRYTLNNYSKANISALSDEALRTFFTQDECDEIKNSKNLNRLLRNPMLVTIYKEICSVIYEFKDIEFLDWRTPVESATDLFYDYYLAQLALMMRRQGITGDKMLFAKICINQILPALAYSFETTYSINKTNADFRPILSAAVDGLIVNEESLSALREHYREYSDLKVNYGIVAEMLVNELHLLHRTKEMTSFVHQMYRDYLSAKYISDNSKNEEKIEALWNSRPIPLPIMTHISKYSRDYWHGIALTIKSFAENKEGLNILLHNLINAFPPYSEHDKIDFSNLDLRDITLPDYPNGGNLISLYGSNINNETLGIYSKNLNPYQIVKLSKDGQYLAALAGAMLEIFNIQSAKEVYHYYLGKRAAQLLFAGQYLFINAGSLVVFINDGAWRYVGEFINESGPVFSSTLKEAFVNDECLTFYYKSRRIRYNLKDCSLIDRWHGNYGIEYPENYWSLMPLKNTVDLKRIDSLESCAIAKDENEYIKAVSYSDGRIEIYQGDELTNIIGKQFSILLDVAISGDGSLAVTLSRETFNGYRRVIIWDLNKKRKTDAIFCTDSIHNINLSEDGAWIIGGTSDKDGKWFYNINSGNEEWSYDEFISNQHGKLVTYGDQILRRCNNGQIEIFNISSGECTDIETTLKHPSIVTFLNNGTLATVSSDGTVLRFFSERNGEEKIISNPGERFIAVQTFKNHPFIAVVADTGLISIYHTGTGQRTRKLENKNVKSVAYHKDKTIFAHVDGNKRLSIEAFEEWMTFDGKRRGLWHHYDCRYKISCKILDMAFNVDDNSLIVIMSNGKILYFTEDRCAYKLSSQIITAFNTKTYDFFGVKCSDELSEILRQNGCKL